MDQSDVSRDIKLMCSVSLVKLSMTISLISLDTSDWSIESIHPRRKGNGPVAADTLEPKQRLLYPIQKIEKSPPGGANAVVEASEESVKVLASTAPRDFGVVLLSPLTGRGSGGGRFQDDFLSLYEGIIDDEYRSFEGTGEVRRNIRFGVENLNIKVIPRTQEEVLSASKSYDWEG